MKKLLITLAVLASFGQSSMAADATTDFSITNGNPNGAWSYGYTTTLGGSFLNYVLGAATSVPGSTGSLDAWNMSSNSVPWVGKAGSSGWTCCSSVIVAANTLTLHPGEGGELSVVRFTAPTTSAYQFNGQFWGQDNAGPANIGTTTDVHVRAGGGDLFTASVVGFGTTKSFSGTVNLTAGQTLDFVVGFGAGLGNQKHYNDSTGLIASVTAVPEPAGIVLAFAGLAVAAGAGLRRRQS